MTQDRFYATGSASWLSCSDNIEVVDVTRGTWECVKWVAEFEENPIL